MKKFFLRLIMAACTIAGITGLVHAQSGIILDGSMGAAGALNGPDYQIKAEYGQQTGANLFHSFQHFNVDTNESATFSGPNSVQNIISRVTGGSHSWIDGEIASTIPNANLFLLNPAGILFGANATLNLTGSFHISTADYLRFGEGSNSDQFYSTPKKGELLSSAAPSAFGFLDDGVQGSLAAPITFQGKEVDKAEWEEDKTGLLKVPEGKTISVIGGDIEMDGIYYKRTISQEEEKDDTPLPRLAAPEGRINIVSAASKGEVNLTSEGVDVASFETMGNINMDHALISVSGEGSGDIFIRSGAFFATKSSLEADTKGSKEGGVTDIQVNTLSLSNSKIFSDTWGTARGGEIQIQATESVNLSDFSKIYADATSYDDDGGDAGSVLIETKELNISNGGTISSDTYGGGKGGSITLRASESVSITGVKRQNMSDDDTESKIFAGASGEGSEAGDAGTILIETNKFSMSEKGIISSDTYYGSGKGGDIIITGADGGFAESVEVSDSQILSGAIDGEEGIAGNADNDGSGGSVEINATNIVFSNGGKIGGESKGAGNGGNILIRSDNAVILKNSSSITTSAFEGGNAGNIAVETANIRLESSASIASESLSENANAGEAGTIMISATDSLRLSDDSALTTEARGAGGGKIFVSAKDEIYLLNSDITSTVKLGEGKGGDITTGSEFVIMNHSTVQANAEDGDGGAIFIYTNNYIKSIDSSVTATSKRGNDGIVKIEAPDTDISSSLMVLPGKYIDATRWMKVPCSARSGESVSRFVIRGRDASPTFLNDWVASPLMWLGDVADSDEVE